MPLADSDYATLAEYKERVSVPAADTSHDAMLQQWLNAAAWVVDRHTRQPIEGYPAFSESSSEVRYFDDDFGTSGSIEIDDAVSVASMTRGDTTISAGQFKTFPYNPGNGPITRLFLRGDSAFPFLAVITTSSWYNYPYRGAGVGQIAVTGTWGYCTAANRPFAVKEATLIMAGMFYQRRSLKRSDLIMAMRNPDTDDLKMVKSLLEPLVKYQGASIA